MILQLQAFRLLLSASPHTSSLVRFLQYRSCRTCNRKTPQDVPLPLLFAAGSIQVWHRKTGRRRRKGTYVPKVTIRGGIFAANVHNIRETDKKNRNFRPYIQGESLQFQKKNIHLPILIGRILRKTSPGTLAP